MTTATAALGWRGVLTHGLTRSVPEELMPAFRRFFVIHIFLQSLKLPRVEQSTEVYPWIGLVFIAVVVACMNRLYRIGLLTLLLYKLWRIVEDFPMTANHMYLETLILFVLLVFSDRRTDPEHGPKAEAMSANLVQMSILLVYFYSGVQKIVHGMWLSGEHVALNLYSFVPFGMPVSVQTFYRWIGSLFDEPAVEFPLRGASGLNAVEQAFPGWAIALFLITGWLVILSELLVPLCVAWPRTRRFGVWLMLVVQLGIGAFAWETEFMFAAVGCILLFFHKRPVRNYSVLLVLHVIWSLSILLMGSKVPTL